MSKQVCWELTCVMAQEHCEISEVHFCSTIGSCPGLLISDEYFQTLENA